MLSSIFSGNFPYSGTDDNRTLQVPVNKILHSCSDNFFWVINTVCGLVLSWLNMTPSQSTSLWSFLVRFYSSFLVLEACIYRSFCLLKFPMDYTSKIPPYRYYHLLWMQRSSSKTYCPFVHISFAVSNTRTFLQASAALLTLSTSCNKQCLICSLLTAILTLTKPTKKWCHTIGFSVKNLAFVYWCERFLTRDWSLFLETWPLGNLWFELLWSDIFLPMHRELVIRYISVNVLCPLWNVFKFCLIALYRFSLQWFIFPAFCCCK